MQLVEIARWSSTITTITLGFEASAVAFGGPGSEGGAGFGEGPPLPSPLRLPVRSPERSPLPSRGPSLESELEQPSGSMRSTQRKRQVETIRAVTGPQTSMFLST